MNRKKDFDCVSLDHVSIGYSKDNHIASGLSAKFELGQTYWVTGASGGGKSTLLKVLAGLVTPLVGKVTFDEVDITDYSFEEFLPFRLNIGYSFEMGGLLNNRTLWDNLMLPLLYHKFSEFNECKERVEFLLESFGIMKYKDLRPASVPGGARKAACVARSFVLNPRLLLLDDPTTGLSEEGVEALEKLLKAEKPQHFIVMTSSLTSWMKSFADYEVKLSPMECKMRPLSASLGKVV